MATDNVNQSGASAAADGAREEAAPLENSTGPDPAAQMPDAAAESGQQVQPSDHNPDAAVAVSPAPEAPASSEPNIASPESAADSETSGAQDFSSMLETYEKESAASKQEGEIVRGLVVGITEQFVLVDIGYKSEGVVAREEFVDRQGNLVVNLRAGLQDKLIKLVQVGDVPGRLEPGTGEINYPFIFKELRRLNWTGYVDTEHGTSSTAEHAMNVVKKMAEEN